MSLTSVELNYLIWRYMQESGFDLAAYAFQKDSACLEYEHASNRLIPAIEPGCLVNFVQKGILYTFLEDPGTGDETRLNLVNAILKDKADISAAHGAEWMQVDDIGAADENNPDVAAKTEESMGENGSKVQETKCATDTLDIAEATEESGPDVPFHTDPLPIFATCDPSVLLHWHPSSNVLALGTDVSTAVIHALGATGIAETVKLNHPPNINNGVPVPSVISVVSWSPQGTLVLTAGGSGEIRAWAPDGRLKNIVNAVSNSGPAPAPVQTLLWNSPGLLVLSVDARNGVCVWEGTSLSLVLEWAASEEPSGVETHACWLGELKVAMTTRNNGIRIFAVDAAHPPGESMLAVGHLSGHDHSITSLCFSPVSKLLALASDTDYLIKVWNSLLTQDALELNVAAEKRPGMAYHILPILELSWLNRAGDVQGNELLSVSMDGSVNVWDAFSGDTLISANVFANPANYAFPESQPEVAIRTKSSLVFAAAVAPGSRLLALGDDAGNVSVWDINTPGYRHTRELIRCVGFFAPTEPGDTTGICDIVWDSRGKFLTVCYTGHESVILQWDKS